MKKRLVWIVSVVSICLVTMLGIAIANNDYDYFLLGKKVFDNKNQVEQSKIVATVNGKEVSKRYFDNIKTSIEMNNPAKSITDDEVLDAVATNVLLFEEAKKKGLVISEEETIKRMGEIKKQFENLPEAKAQFDDYIKGLGMTEEEFWNNPETIQGYQEAFSTDELRSQALKEAKVEQSQANKFLAEFEKNIKGNAKIEKIK